ncbi:Uncharacterised protein [Mycobacteroides abscessus subsp. abscessus]|nr:Uncharacterised protein [Mycobacteroides abscessus subsp. abscessus]
MSSTPRSLATANSTSSGGVVCGVCATPSMRLAWS